MMKNLTRLICAVLTLAGLSQEIRSADLPLADGDRIVFLGDSLTYHDGFPNYTNYLATYLINRNPSLTLHIQALGRSGLALGGCLDSSPIGYQHYSKWAEPLAPKYVMVMFADNGGYDKATDKQLMQTLVDDYIVGRSHASPVLLGMIPQANPDGYHLGGQFDDANEEIALAANPQLRYFKLWRALSPTWTSNIIFTADASTGTLTAAGHGFTNGTRVIFQGGTAPNPLVPGNNYYIRDATADKFRLTNISGGTAIDLTSNGTGTMRISANWAKLRAGTTDGGVHPGPSGSLIAAWKLITGLGWSVEVSDAAIDATSRTVTSQKDCSITNLTRNTFGGIDFSRLDARLPWAIDEVARPDAVALFPAMAGWQKYDLTITGLAAGNYEVYCSGELIASVSSSTLAAGWNMSDLTVGPVWRQCQEVLGRIREMQGVDRTTLFAIQGGSRTGVERYASAANGAYATNGLRGAQLVAALAPYIAQLGAADSLIHAAAQPTTLSFSIRRKAPRAWKYPGIPYPDWKQDPFLLPSPTRPDNWPKSDKTGFYYIEKDNPNATDVVDGSDQVDANGKRYGYPERPRRTLPLTGWNNTNFRAGSVLWIRGGEWDTHYGGFSDWFANWDGTADNPCWIYGDPEMKPVFKDLRIGFSGQNAHYVFVENIVWDKWTAKNSSSVTAADGAHHIAVRHCLVQNRDYNGAHGSHFAVSAGATAGLHDCHDLVFYDIDFKNNGRGVDWKTVDADYHAFKPDGTWGGGRVYRMWVVGCHLYPGDTPDPIDGFYKSISGTFIQVGDQLVTHGNVDHVYVAGNVTQFQRQAVIGCKRCADVIGSGNIARAGSGIDYNMFNTKYDRQDHLWFIAN